MGEEVLTKTTYCALEFSQSSTILKRIWETKQMAHFWGHFGLFCVCLRRTAIFFNFVLPLFSVYCTLTMCQVSEKARAKNEKKLSQADCHDFIWIVEVRANMAGISHEHRSLWNIKKLSDHFRKNRFKRFKITLIVWRSTLQFFSG